MDESRLAQLERGTQLRLVVDIERIVDGSMCKFPAGTIVFLYSATSPITVTTAKGERFAVLLEMFEEVPGGKLWTAAAA